MQGGHDTSQCPYMTSDYFLNSPMIPKRMGDFFSCAVMRLSGKLTKFANY